MDANQTIESIVRARFAPDAVIGVESVRADGAYGDPIWRVNVMLNDGAQASGHVVLDLTHALVEALREGPREDRDRFPILGFKSSTDNPRSLAAAH